MFEESKIWVLLALVAIFSAFGYSAHYLSSVDEANLALQESKSKLADMNQMLSLRRKSWDENENILKKIQTETDKNATLVKAKEILDQRYRKDVSDLKYALESMKTSVERTRSNAPGTELGEIALANGKTLHGVKIRKVEETGISLIHADGIGTISLDLLPDSLKEQYDLGPNALVPMIQQAQTALLHKPEKDTANKLPIQPATTTPEVKAPIDDSKAKKIKLRMAELDASIANCGSLATKYRNAASSHQSLEEAAKSRGVPSTRHTENANKNLAQAALLESQMAQLREERGKLNVELEYALKGK